MGDRLEPLATTAAVPGGNRFTAVVEGGNVSFLFLTQRVSFEAGFCQMWTALFCSSVMIDVLVLIGVKKYSSRPQLIFCLAWCVNLCNFSHYFFRL